MAALPTTTHPPATPPISRWRLPRHRILVALVLLSSLLVLLSLYTLSSAPGIDAVRRTFTAISQSHARPPPTPPPASPPLPPFPVDRGMATIIEWESALPQLAPLDIHGGGRYLRFLNEAWGVGFNNQLQEIIAHAHLAYLSNRSYVVQPLNFPGESEWYPLSAFLRGALVGSPSSPHDHPYTADPILAPHPRPSPLRAVSRAKFASACPDYEHAPELDYDTIARTLEAQHSPAKSDSDSGSAHAPRGDTGGLRPAPSYMTVSVAPLARAFGFEQDTPADVIMRGWEGLLGVGGGRAKGAASARDSADGQLNNPELPALAPGDATCVTVHPESEHLMDYRVYSTNRIIPLVPELVASPVLTDLHWSPLVHAAAQRNLRAWGWIARAGASGARSNAHGQRHRQGGAWAPDRPDGMDGAATPRHDSAHAARAHAAQHADPADTSLAADTHVPLARVLALHLRRGDFESHCVVLAKYNAAWQGVNQADGVVDRYDPPPEGLKTPAQLAEFARRCWPTVDDIIQRVRLVREEWEDRLRGRAGRRMARRDPDGGHYTNATGTDWRLNTVYVATNGDAVWWAAVAAALRADGWAVRGSADMDFMQDDDEYVYNGPSPTMPVENEGRFIRDTQGKERGSFREGLVERDADGEARWRNRRQGERVVGLAVDMEIAARAEVFIGNGWSSYTADVNLLRMAHGAPRASIRFW